MLEAKLGELLSAKLGMILNNLAELDAKGTDANAREIMNKA